MTPRASELVLHIGTEKTGSTSIQSHLATNDERLRAAGILVPRAGTDRASTADHGGAWHLGIATACCDWQRTQDLAQRFGLRSEDDQIGFRERTLRELGDELGAASFEVGKLVLSCEHFHSRYFSPESVERLAAALAPHADRITVVVYVARQDRLAVKKASTSVVAGAMNLADVIPAARGPRGRLNPYYDYAGLWDRYRRAFPDAEIRVRTVGGRDPGDTDVVDDFFDVLGLGTSDFERVGSRNEGLRLSPAGLRVLDLLTGRFGRTALQYSARGLVNRLRQLAPGSGFSELVDRTAAIEFMHAFAESNDRLARDAGLATPLFDDDFEDYASGPSPVDQESVDLLVALLGELGRENLRLLRSSSIDQALGHPPLRTPDRRDPLPALRLSGARGTLRVEGGDLFDPLAVDEHWGVAPGGPVRPAQSDGAATAWMIVENSQGPRRLSIELLGGSSERLTVTATTGASRARGSGGTVVLAIPTGVHVVEITAELSDDDGSGDRDSDDQGFDGLQLRWA